MKHLFVPYDIARQLKEKGFDEPCLGIHYRYSKEKGLKCLGVTQSSQLRGTLSKSILAPLYQQVIDWFRENHDIVINVNKDYHGGNMLGWDGTIEHGDDGFINTNTLPTHYEALTKAIEKALKLI